MQSLIEYLFGAASFMPHGFCLLWRPDLVAMHAVSDTIIAISYFAIPALIYWYLNSRKDLDYPWVLHLFAAFILLCGTTHVIGLLTLWWPAYGLQGLVKAATAAVSAATALLLMPLIPKLMTMPTPAQLREKNRKLATAIIAQKRALNEFDSLFEFAPDATLILDSEGKILRANWQTTALFGIQQDALTAMNVIDILSRADGDASSTLLDGLTNPQSQQQFRDATGVRKDGTSFPMRISFGSIQHKGKPATILALRDTTDWWKAAAERETLIDQLGETNAALRDFTRIASHDMRSPLNVIEGMNSLMSEALDNNDDDEAKFLSSRIAKASSRLSALLETLRQYNLVQDGEAKFQVCSLKQIASEAIDSLGTEIARTGAGVTVDQLPEVDGDKPQLIQLLQNLIGNAIKYCDAETPQVSIAAKSSGDYWQVSVTDNGIGIAKEHVSKIFQPAVRLHTNEEYEGTGLGLATCKKIVERHTGSIWCESREGEGTTMVFTIPKAGTITNHETLPGSGQT